MSKSTMTREEAERALKEIMPQVADELGWDIVEREDSHVVEMRAPEGYSVYFNVGWSSGYGTVSVGGAWPRDAKGQQVMPAYNSKLPRINVSLGRGALAIVREVRWRLLPEYVPLWGKAMERMAESQQFEGETEKNAVALAKIAGVPNSEIRDGKFSLYRSTKFPENLSDVEVSGDSVKLELRCTYDEARAILGALVEASGS